MDLLPGPQILTLVSVLLRCYKWEDPLRGDARTPPAPSHVHISRDACCSEPWPLRGHAHSSLRLVCPGAAMGRGETLRSQPHQERIRAERAEEAVERGIRGLNRHHHRPRGEASEGQHALQPSFSTSLICSPISVSLSPSAWICRY